MEIDFLCHNLIQKVTCLGGNVRTAQLIELLFITEHLHIIKRKQQSKKIEGPAF